MTTYEVHGLVVDDIVVNMSMEKSVYSNGKGYVAMSKITTYNKVHIINYHGYQIKPRRHSMKWKDYRKIPNTPIALHKS